MFSVCIDRSLACKCSRLSSRFIIKGLLCARNIKTSPADVQKRDYSIIYFSLYCTSTICLASSFIPGNVNKCHDVRLSFASVVSKISELKKIDYDNATICAEFLPHLFHFCFSKFHSHVPDRSDLKCTLRHKLWSNEKKKSTINARMNIKFRWHTNSISTPRCEFLSIFFLSFRFSKIFSLRCYCFQTQLSREK